MTCRTVARLASTLLLIAASTLVSAQNLTFEGLQNGEPIGGYYNGATGGLGSGPGPNFGVTFAPNALAVIRNDAGGTGNFRNNPSGITTMSFTAGVGAFMNVPAGFTTGFSFFYSTSQVGSVRVFSGVDGTGTLLATIPLPANNSGFQCNVGAPPSFFCNWSPTGVSFVGTAMSVDFGGTANQIGFDNITLAAAIPVGAVILTPSIPVPTLGEYGLALLALLTALGGGLAIRRRGF